MKMTSKEIEAVIWPIKYMVLEEFKKLYPPKKNKSLEINKMILDIKKELQARLDFIMEKLKHEKIVNTKPYRIYFRDFVAGCTRGYIAEIYFLESLIEKLDKE